MQNTKIYYGLIRRLLLSWISASALEYFLLPQGMHSLATTAGLQHMSFPRLLVVTAVLFAVFSFLSRHWSADILERRLLLGVVILLSAVSLFFNFSFAFLCAVFLLAGILGVYAIYGYDFSSRETVLTEKTHRRTVIALTACTLIFCAFISIWTACRIYCAVAPTYDLGLFSQMFHQMKKTGLPITTLERDGALSHFAVHVSPIFYLLLPIYYVFSSPVTLQVLQAVIMSSAVIPLWKLARHHGLSPKASLFVCLILLVYPAYAGGASYDIHENAFLTPLLLWLFYAIDVRKTSLVAIFSVLTLCVKEDAAVYVATVALWLLLRSLLSHDDKRRWGFFVGGALLAGSVLWFFAATSYLANFGDGVMTYRYENFIYDGSSSLLTVIKAAILSPIKVLYECFEFEKLAFVVITLLPLLGLPLFTRRYERFVLLIPYVLVNLMSDYPYQHSIFFQYSYGSIACLFYLTVVNLSEIKNPSRLLKPALLLAVLCFIFFIIPLSVPYPSTYIKNMDSYEVLHDTLAQIPDDASVAATTFLTTALSHRDVIYDVDFCSMEHLFEPEYVVLGLEYEDSFARFSVGDKKGYEALQILLEQQGYTLWREIKDVVTIYKK